MDQSPEIKQKVEELIVELKNEDINKENLLKAGTEIELNMSREFQKQIEEKFIQLRKEFNSIDKNADSKLSIDELYQFFNSKNPQVKKEDIQSLFELMDKNKNSKISLNEFVYMYLLLEEKLKLKKEDLTIVKNNLKRQLEKYEQKLKENEKEEYYSQGISKQSELTIRIMEINNLVGINKCKIILNLMDNSGHIIDEKETQTQVKYGEEPIFKFNEVFSFQIIDNNCYVKCIISDSDTLINEGHGYFIINLLDYLDQLNKEKYVNIIGEQNLAQVHFECNYIYNIQKKYKDLIAKKSQQMDKINQSIFQLENLIDKINEPYGLLYYNKIKEILDKKILDKNENVNEYLTGSRISIYSSQRNSKFSYSESPNKMRNTGGYDNDASKIRIKGDGLDIIQEEGGEAINSNLLRNNEIKSTEGYLPEDYNKYFPKNSLIGKKGTQLNILGIIVSFISFLAGKFDAFNLILYFFGLMMAYNLGNINGRLDTRRYYFYALLAIIVFDTFWILFLNREQNIESSFWRVIVFGLTIISLIIKIVLSYLIKNRRR